MNTALIRPIKTEADYQAALNRAGILMSCSPNTPEADGLEVLATLEGDSYAVTKKPQGL